MLAAAAALALAWTVLTIEIPWLAENRDLKHPEGTACLEDAAEANLDFTLKDANDNPVTLSDHRGKVILLDFWATWCLPCKVEIPWFIEFQNKYRSQGFQVIGISVDDSLDKLTPYMAAMKMNYIVLQGLGRSDVIDAYGPIVGLPMTLLISREGKICLRHTGLISKPLLEDHIKGLL
jgi:thiol-disulfide isomerase/thioredoxin